MGYKSKYKGSEIDSLLDKAKNDYTVKQYTDYAGYNADTSRPSNTISLIQQDQSIVVGDKRYSQNAECFVGSDVSGISTTGNWFLVGETTFSQYTDVNIIGSAVSTHAGGMGGLFVLNLRSDQLSINPNYTFQWLCKVGPDATTPVLRYVISGMTIKLYCKVFGGQYKRIHIRIFNQVNRAGHAVHKEAFFKLKDSTTIIPEADVPSGTDIADVLYLLKSGGTVTGAVTFKEWLYNDKPVRNKQGEYAHIAYKTRGTVGYVKVATITINQTHADEPICFEIMQRQQPLAKLTLQYATAGNTNPPLNTFTYQGTSVNRYYLHQTGSGVWDLYIGKLDSWTAITVSKVYIGGYSSGFYQNAMFSITWQDELVTAVPEGSVAATKATEYVNISGTAASAAQSNKVWYDFTDTANEDMRVLFGRANNNKDYDSVFKSSKLLFNPSTNTLTVPNIAGLADRAKTLRHCYSARMIGTTNNPLYHRFLSIGSKEKPLTKDNTNYVAILMITSSSKRDCCGILMVTVRRQSGTSGSGMGLKWYYKGDDNAYYNIYSGFNADPATTYLDLYFKDTEAWQNYEVTLLSYGIRGGIANTDEIKLHNAYYNGTTVTEYYNSVTAAGKAIHGHTDTAGYSSVVEESPESIAIGGYVNRAINATQSTKLTTARKIGFANFDGSADLSLNVIQGANVTRWSSSGTLKPNQWIRLIRMKFSQTWGNVSITLAIEECEQQIFRGVINFSARVGGDLNPSVNLSSAVWYSLYQVNRSSFGDVTQYIRMVPVAPTDNDANGYVDVYVMSPLGAISYGWHVINDRQVNNASFTLKADTTAIIDNENFPTSYKSSGFQGVLATGDTIEYGSWVTKATTADSAAVANKTKYPIVFKRNGASITNWFANTTFTIDIPEELLDYSAPTGITLKVPDEAKKVANDLEIRVNGKQKATFDGSSAKTVNIEASRSHFVKASMYGEYWTSPPAGATTPGVPLILDTSYMIPFGTLQDGDTIIMQVPNTLTSTSGYPVYLRLDTTQGNVAGNLVKIIKGQNAGNPVEWKGTTALTAGYYHFVYSEGAGGLIFMYRNVSTS